MARPGDRRIIRSLFDRLTDNEPRNSREILPPESDQLREYKESVARDLTNLLNTRRSEADIGEQFEETRQSLAAYGLQDFSMAPVDREAIRRTLERTVRLFEPRLSRVQVNLLEGGNFRLSFQVLGILRLDVGLEPVVFNAELPTESRRFQVKAGR